MNKWDIAIVGGGPAGLGAAIEAAKTGARVILIDENHTAGGQLFKQIHKFFGSRAHRAGVRGIRIAQDLLKEIEELNVTVWLSSAVVGMFDDNTLLVRREENGVGHIVTLAAHNILFATGASENAVNFPGWTLPGVMGAGAAQTMINVNRVLPGKRVLMVGSGNVGLIVSYQLMQAGADVLGIVEAADRIGGYGVHAGKVRRAGVDFHLRHSVVRAEGDTKLERVTIARLDDDWKFIPGTEKSFDVDTLCLAVGLRPLTELVYQSGARQIFVPEMSGWVPAHDADMMTTTDGVFVAGDVTGVEEANTALDEGRLAGVAMAERQGILGRGEAAERKKEIIDRLASLRMGPFGKKRADAKSRMLEYRKSFVDQGVPFVKGRV